MAKKNHFQINRSLLQHPIWLSEPFTKGQAWVDLIGKANHTDSFFYKNGIRIDVARGQVADSMLTLTKRWKWSRGKVSRFLNLLEKDKMILQKRGQQTTLLTICNYEAYQLGDGKDRTTDRTSDRTTDGHQIGHIQKELKKNKKRTKKKDNTSAPKNAEFEDWWKTYPKRAGRRVGKKAALRMFKKVKDVDLKNLWKATENYSRECNGKPKDAERFIRNEFWKEYLGKPDNGAGKDLTPRQQQANDDFLAVLEEDERERENAG